jgi:hypothetical protein
MELQQSSNVINQQRVNIAWICRMDEANSQTGSEGHRDKQSKAGAGQQAGRIEAGTLAHTGPSLMKKGGKSTSACETTWIFVWLLLPCHNAESQKTNSSCSR